MRNESTSLAASVNPMVLSSDRRSWVDLNRDGLPQLNELGPSTGWRGGPTTRIDPNVTRPYNWEFTLGVDHELVPRVAVGAMYYQRLHRNMIGTRNLLVTPNDYTAVTITDPLTGKPLTVYDRGAGGRARSWPARRDSSRADDPHRPEHQVLTTVRVSSAVASGNRQMQTRGDTEMSKHAHTSKRRVPGWLAVALLLVVGPLTDAQMPAGPVNLGTLPYRFIGPPGNRVSAVAGVPGDPNTYYVGAASGGVWKSSDGGINWKPVFDAQAVQSIGSLAITPSDPSIVWAGTGEPFLRSNVSIGDGIYKSTDAGRTWVHMGLEKTGRIARIVIDPHDPNVVFAAALGTCYGPQPERGVYRTRDGGKTWERVLFVDENTGAADIAMDPSHSQTLFAATWQVDIKTWGRWSGGPGSGVYVSRDGGTTWKHVVGHGLPDSPLGRIGVAIAPSNSNRVYALIETGEHGSGTLWRSEDSGENWKVVNYSRVLNGRPHYNTRMAVSPIDQDEVYFISDIISISHDGGETTESSMGGDNHDMWFDPRDANRIIVGNDGGAEISRNHGAEWQRVVLPIAQMYHVDVDSRVPYYVYGNRQDGAAYRGPSNGLLADYGVITVPTISSAQWTQGPGCESGFQIPDPVDNNLVWGTCYSGWLDTWDVRTQHRRSVRVWPDSSVGWPAGQVKYRFNWTFPLAISPHDHNKVYVGSQHVHQTTNRGQSWTVISPDLSTGDQSRLQSSGGLTPDNLSPEYGGVVFAIAESPLEKGQIWAGTNDGLLHVTRDGGAHWTNVTPTTGGMPPLGTVSNIEPSRFDAGTAYVSFDLHQVNNRDPFIYKLTNYGKTSKLISSGIPKSVFSYAHVVREDPVRKGLLYAGTENGLYVSFDDGANWAPMQNNLPHAPVHWLVIQPQFNDLVVATYGRGFWIMDDVTPLQQATPQVLDSPVHLFAPRPAYRFAGQIGTLPRAVPNDQVIGRNPPYGASINYYLKSAPKEDVTIAIQDDGGQVVRTLAGPKQAGLNRVWWDLRYELPKDAKLRTTPPNYPQIWREKRYQDVHEKGGSRPLITYRADDGKIAPRVAPGTFTVKLTVAGQSVTQRLVVKKDPNTAGTDADVRAQVKAALEIYHDRNTTVDAINQIEVVRKQLEDMVELFSDDGRQKQLATAASELNKKLFEVESTYFDPVFAEGDLKTFRAPQRLYGKLQMLLWDIVSAADYQPTDQELEVQEELKKQVAIVQSRLSQVLDKDVRAFNALLAQSGQPGIVVPKP